jgi:hypothetical protein
LAAPSVGGEDFTNSLRISKAYAQVNFGLVEIEWEAQPATRVTLKAIGLDGKSVIEHEIGLEELRVRSE